MFIIGITGQSGSGKSAISKIMLSFGYSIIDADSVYHDIISPPSACLDELVSEFGRGILTAGGFLNRQALASLVFDKKNGDKLERLNQITHKHIIERIRKIICGMRAMGTSVCVIDAPLLIESGLNDLCDMTVYVQADRDVRIQRIMDRDKISQSCATERVDAQKSDDFYIDNTDCSICNESDIDSLSLKVQELLISRGVTHG